MVILVVFCHPARESFCGAIFERVRQKLASQGHRLIVRDLYAENFEPALSVEEFARYYQEPENAEAVCDYVDDLSAAEAIVLIYPTWWYGMPAMVKGYLDRVWLPGVAFGLDGKGGVTTHALRHIRSLMVVTTYGSPWAWIKLYMGDPGRKTVERGLRRLFSPSCRTAWLAMYGMDASTPKQRAAFLSKVDRALAAYGG
jgi:NAD(P)H dehydrogenase (quinone)